MSWDYDKLFAVGNIVGLKNVELDYVFVHQVDSGDINDMLREEDDIYPVDWDDYRNSRLAFCGMEIEYIIRPNEDWSSVERLFIRDRDMPNPMPKLKTGMIVEVFDNFGYSKGIVAGNRVVYQTGGCDSVEEFNDEGLTDTNGYFITSIWDTKSFDLCYDDNRIWRKTNFS